MKGTRSSKWNKRVVEILLEDLLGRKAAENNWRSLPDHTEAYFLDLIEEKIQRVKVPWRNAQIKLKETGQLETPEEVEQWMIYAKEERMKRSHVATRRRTVSHRSISGNERRNPEFQLHYIAEVLSATPSCHKDH